MHLFYTAGNEDLTGSVCSFKYNILLFVGTSSWKHWTNIRYSQIHFRYTNSGTL